MVIQYAKFLKMAEERRWRRPVPALNYIESSTLWRQEHNGYSHQDPMFINNLVNMKPRLIRVFFPPDANSALCVLEECLQSTNRYISLSPHSSFPVSADWEFAIRSRRINLIVCTKNPVPCWNPLPVRPRKPSTATT